MVLDYLFEGLEVVECLKLISFFNELDWTLFEELVIKQSKERLVKIH